MAFRKEIKRHVLKEAKWGPAYECAYCRGYFNHAFKRVNWKNENPTEPSTCSQRPSDKAYELMVELRKRGYKCSASANLLGVSTHWRQRRPYLSKHYDVRHVALAHILSEMEP